MVAKKTTAKKAPAAVPDKSDPNAFKVVETEDTKSQMLAKLVTSSTLSAATLKQFSGAGDDLEVSDLVREMKKAGDQAVAGDLCRVERMLANQLMTLDMLFNNLAQRSGRQETFRGIEVLMRLALKAQAQSRATAETLAVIKNPMPFIKQANIAHGGHQQVNNTYAGTPSHSGIQSGAGSFQSGQNKLMEAQHGNTLDFGAQAAAIRADQALETVGAVHRA